MTAQPPTRRDGEKTSAKRKVFVSYAREDWSFVERLVSNLKGDDFEVWFDRERLRGGDSIPTEIADAIKESDFFLLVVSRSSNKSDWVRDELEKAVTWRNDSGWPKTIPLLLGNSPLPSTMVGRQRVQFRTAGYDGGYAELRSILLEEPLPAARPSRKKVVLAAATALLLLAGLGVWRFFHRPRDMPTIVVTSFTNASGRPGDVWISTALGDMLTAALRAGGGARIVDRKTISEAEKDFHLAGTTPSPSDFRRRLGADYVVSGSFEQPGEALTLSWTVADTTWWGGSSPDKMAGSLAELVGLVSDLADKVRTHVGLHSLARQQRKALQTLFPKTTKGQEPYFAGMASYRRFDPSTAYIRLTAARTIEPNQPMIYQGLAGAAWMINRAEEAEGFARKAQQLARTLPPRERLEIELTMPKATGDWDEVISRYKELTKLAQSARAEDYSYWFELASAQVFAGNPREALDTLKALLTQERTPPLYVQAKASYLEADINDDLGEPEEAHHLVDLAVEDAKGAGAVYLLAQAQLLRSQILSRLGKHKLAETDLAAAQRTFSQAGDELSVRVCEEQKAILQFYQGSQPLAAILTNLRELEKAYRSEGADEELVRVLTLESMVLAERGRFADAESMLKEAEAVSGNEHLDLLVSCLVEQALTLTLSGKPDEAEARANLALRKVNTGISSRAATAFSRLAESAYYRGKLDDAKNYLEPALGGHSGSLKAFDRFRLGMILAAQGKPEGREEIEEAYELQEQVAYRVETALGLARLDNLAGDFKEAADLAENAAKELGNTDRPDVVALAQAARSWALACEGETETAGKILAEVEKRESQDFRVRFETAIAAARLRAVSSESHTKVVQDLERIAQDAEDKKLLFYALDARLALGEIKLALGTGGQAYLRTLEADAARSGFRQTAQLAARMLKEGPICKTLRRQSGDAPHPD